MEEQRPTVVRSLLTTTRHETFNEASDQVKEIVGAEFKIEFITDNLNGRRSVLFHIPVGTEWGMGSSPVRVPITWKWWAQLNSPDTATQFEGICKIRDLVQQIQMRLDARERGGYD